jgi:hypothetical protein
MMDTPASSAPPGSGSAATTAPPREEPDTTAPPGSGSAATAAPPREEPDTTAPSAPSAPPDDGPSTIDAIEGPVWVAWREGTLTRAKELEALSLWVRPRDKYGNNKVLVAAVRCHLHAARQAAKVDPLDPPRRLRIFRGIVRNGPLIERARSNLDAAEAHLLSLAPNSYILGQMPCLLNHVQCHLSRTDARRQEFERIAQKLGIKDPDHPSLEKEKELSCDAKEAIVEDERRKIINIVRGASSAGLREHVRLRSFRNVVVITAMLMTVLAIGVAITGFLQPTLIPMCFAPQEAGTVTVVCPTAQSEPFVPLGETPQPPLPMRKTDNVVKDTAKQQDLLVVELVGLTAAAIATAAAIRRIKGSSERYGLPLALAVLKLPTGAITAFLGLLLMRGQFVPGLSALDTPAQILAWALVFGYAQQLFTRLVDQQGQTVLDNVRGADRPQPAPSSP